MVSQSKQTELIPVRVGFFKTGALQFISHLDLTRCMTHTIARAGVPILYSQGFNPHPKMVFSLPLSIGVESIREYLDFKLVQPMDFSEIRERLNAQLPEQMQVTRVYTPQRKLDQIGYASYEICLWMPGADSALAAELEELYHGEMIVTKRTKSGEKEVDISPFVRGAAVKYDAERKKIIVHAKLCADSANYLNPEYLLRGAEKYLSINFEDPFHSGYSILRRELYLADGITVFE